MIANEKCNLPFSFWQTKMTKLLPVPLAAKLNRAIPPESSHLGPTTFFARDPKWRGANYKKTANTRL